MAEQRVFKLSRRAFMLSAAALPIGSILAASLDERPGAVARGHDAIRRVELGQRWRYARRDGFTGKLLDEEVARVAGLGETIEIGRRKEHPADGSDRRASSRFRQWIGSREDAAQTADLTSEIQGPAGLILVDPHWDLVQVYDTAIPLWPAELRPGWSVRVNTRYSTPGSRTALAWQQTMVAREWETVHVPAGSFQALRYTNLINFTHSDWSRTDCVREETLWFAPEVGRWIARHSGGTYYIDDSGIDQPFNEDNLRWELLEYA
jgi:hypothetical protein